MEYWNLTSKGRGQRSLTLGTQYRAFSSGIRRHDEAKGNEIKGRKEAGEESVEATNNSRNESEENKKETKEGGGDTIAPETGLHSNGNGGENEREKREGSSSSVVERDSTESKEKEQESSESKRDEQPSGEDGK